MSFFYDRFLQKNFYSWLFYTICYWSVKSKVGEHINRRLIAFWMGGRRARPIYSPVCSIEMLVGRVVLNQKYTNCVCVPLPFGSVAPKENGRSSQQAAGLRLKNNSSFRVWSFFASHCVGWKTYRFAYFWMHWWSFCWNKVKIFTLDIWFYWVRTSFNKQLYTTLKTKTNVIFKKLCFLAPFVWRKK